MICHVLNIQLKRKEQLIQDLKEVQVITIYQHKYISSFFYHDKKMNSLDNSP